MQPLQIIVVTGHLSGYTRGQAQQRVRRHFSEELHVVLLESTCPVAHVAHVAHAVCAMYTPSVKWIHMDTTYRARCEHSAWIQDGAWGMGHGAWGMGHGAWSLGMGFELGALCAAANASDDPIETTHTLTLTRARAIHPLCL